MIWSKADLAWFTALAIALTMRESPIVSVISNQRTVNHVEEKAA